MNTLLHIQSSICSDAGASSTLARPFVGQWRARDAGTDTVMREFATRPGQRASVQQVANRAAVALGSSSMQWRHTVIIRRTDERADRQQRLHRLEVARTRRVHQRRGAYRRGRPRKLGKQAHDAPQAVIAQRAQHAAAL